jgi:hypothetical protein
MKRRVYTFQIVLTLVEVAIYYNQVIKQSDDRNS